jgi:hypothetical protein
MESIIIKVPKKSDAKMLIEISKRMGFVAESLEQKLNRMVRTAPKNVPISDDEIMEEVYASRSKRKK